MRPVINYGADGDSSSPPPAAAAAAASSTSTPTTTTTAAAAAAAAAGCYYYYYYYYYYDYYDYDDHDDDDAMRAPASFGISTLGCSAGKKGLRPTGFEVRLPQISEVTSVHTQTSTLLLNTKNPSKFPNQELQAHWLLRRARPLQQKQLPARGGVRILILASFEANTSSVKIW